MFSLLVSAHTVNDWLVVDNEAVLVENSNPTPSNLEVRDHILDREISVGATLSFEVHPEKLSLPDSSLVSAELSNGEKYEGNRFTIKFNETGTYFLDVYFSSPGQGDELSEEGIIINVGALPFTPNVLVKGQIFEPSSEVRIARSQKTDFQISNPVESYKYLWDLGTMVAEGTIVEETFLNQKMPFYLTLRTLDENTNTYSDSYLKLVTNEEQVYEIVEPHVEFSDVSKSAESAQTLQLVVIISILVIVISVATLLYLLKIKTNNK